MQVLVTRPADQGLATLRRLATAGYAGRSEPVLVLRDLATDPPAIDPAALVVTSANAVPAAAARLATAGRPVFAVGDATARALEQAGFRSVRASGGDGAALARLVADAVPAGSRILHVVGRHRHPEPGRSLAAAGFVVTIWEAYAVEAVATLPPGLGAALSQGRLDAALHYSRRSAETLVRLTVEAGLGHRLAELLHVCLSAEVARGLETLARQGGSVRLRSTIAAEPTEDALLATLGGARQAGEGSPRDETR